MASASAWPATEQPDVPATDVARTHADAEKTRPTIPMQQPQPAPQDVAVRTERLLSQPPLEKSAPAWPATEQPDGARTQADADDGMWQLQTTGTYLWVTASALAWPAAAQSQSLTEEPKTKKPKTEVSLDADTPPWAAAKAMLTATGMLKPKTSTATEHAMTPSQGASTDVLPRMSALSPDIVEKIVALLLWSTHDFQPRIHADDIEVEAIEALIKYCDSATRDTRGFLHTGAVANLSQLIDIMVLQKDGSPRDPNATFQFMRRIVSIRDQRLEHLPLPSFATERVELDDIDVSWCYQRLGHNLITHDLLPHQKQDRRYRLRGSVLSTFQRSFVDCVIRKSLGDKRVAQAILQRGLPSVVDPPHFKVLDKRMLQSGLHECLQWYVALANDLLAHQGQPGFVAQVAASSLDTEQRQRQHAHRDALRLRARQRAYKNMDETEQKTLEDYERRIALLRMPLRCKLETKD